MHSILLVATHAASHVSALRFEPAEPQLIDIDATLFIQLGLFLGLVAILRQLFFKPFLALKDAREAVTDQPKRDAHDLETRAFTLAGEYDRKIAEARTRGQEERRTLSARSQARERGIREAVRTEVGATLAAARSRLADEGKKARSALAAEVDTLGRKMAERLLGRALS